MVKVGIVYYSKWRRQSEAILEHLEISGMRTYHGDNEYVTIEIERIALGV